MYFIADIAANHDKNLNRCYELIYRAKESGADAVKFQHYKATNLISKEGFERYGKVQHQSKWEKTVYETYADFSLPYEWTASIADYCKTIGIDFMSTPYDLEALDIIDPFVKWHKIGSGDIDYIDLLIAVNGKNKKVFLATGAADISDVGMAMNCLDKCPKVLMQCNTNYTKSIDNKTYINLNVLKTFKSLYPDCELGLSDHNKDNKIILGAIAIGAEYIERHFTDGQSRSPDNDFALKPYEWREMVNDAKDFYKMLGDGVKKVEANEEEERVIQRRCWYAANNIKKNSIIDKKDIVLKRPAIQAGLPASYPLYGDIALRDIAAGEVIGYGDISET